MTCPPVRRLRFALLTFVVSLVIAPGCASAPAKAKRMTPEKLQVMNLRTSIDLLRAALADSQGQRDDFQQRYLASRSEAENLRGIQLDLDARYRVRLNDIAEATRSLQLASHESALKNLRIGELEGLARGVTSVRDDAEKQIKKLESELRDMRSRVQAVRRERETLAVGLEDAEREIVLLRKNGAEVPEVVTQQMTALRLRSEDLRSQVRLLEDKLRDVRSERDKALKTLRGAGLGSTASEPEAGELTSLAALSQWARQAVNDIRDNKWNRDATIFAAAVGGLLLLVILAFVFARRRRGKRPVSTADALEARSLSQVSTPQPRPVQSAPRSPRAASAETVPIKTQTVMAGRVPQPADELSVLDVSPASTAAAMQPPGPEGDPTSVLNDPQERTERLPAVPDTLSGTVVIQKDSRRGPKGSKDEDALLADLQKMIQKNFTGKEE